MINWKVRIKNKLFWVAIIPAILLLVQQVASIFGVVIDFTELKGQLLAVVGTVFELLAIVGIVTDHTTKGVSDSKQALEYNEPKDDSIKG